MVSFCNWFCLRLCIVLFNIEIMSFHIHRFKTKDVLFEQPTDVQGVYCDYRIKKCRCGEIKRVFDRIYYADKMRFPFHSNPDISFLGLGNKRDIIPNLI